MTLKPGPRGTGDAKVPLPADGVTATPHRSMITLPHERETFARMRGTEERVADAITRSAGRMRFAYLHAVWFAGWILVNLGVFGKAAVFDPYPFGLLTMVVSLEAIFLSTFVMVSQNRQSARDNIRADIDFETNLRSEVWSAHIGRSLGLDAQQVELEVQRLVARSRTRLDGSPADPAGGLPGTPEPASLPKPA
ncbi:DUF1003 domain-containing protein [Parafrankia sp. EUN1f]|uniref:DUF1003 domain-containing protein n=1 Tax=Parafrankia sp. EUN1f TaxID=102897 RepID=UPI0001C44380|nr:DUF1003 domain-containing protein [Parafrankia sp. EUN1f]EFC82965.1 protein of unknown function DUF1003 [Parafrankia sp. EUN1f]